MSLDTSDYFTDAMFVEPTNPERFEDTYAADTQGRLAQPHPNRYPISPSPRELWFKAQGAANLLYVYRNNDEGDLPPEALHFMVRAYELLDDLDHEIPRVYGFVCRYKIRFGSMTTDHYSEFSAHESMVEAIKWAMEWERKIPHGEKGLVGGVGPWEIAWAPARVRDFRAFGTDPSKFIRTYR